ncbi:MAG: hypothetical protein GF334_13010 [Candidatus Altiarchaeales archaeon]|nr:hypothetical protein [Candidatus Altiarchaeales archaeon]
MHYLKSLCVGEPSTWVHDFFVRYSRGEFEGPFLCCKVKKDVKVKASYEWATYLGDLVVSDVDCDFKVDGGIYGKRDFRPVLDELGLEYKDSSKKGFFQVKIRGEVPAAVLRRVYGGLEDVFVLLSLVPREKVSARIKCGKKPPKPGKKRKTDFVSATLPLEALEGFVEEVFFEEKPGFREAEVDYLFEIRELEIPEGMSAAEARVEAKRKGFIKRRSMVDGREDVAEYPLLI